MAEVPEFDVQEYVPDVDFEVFIPSVCYRLNRQIAMINGTAL